MPAAMEVAGVERSAIQRLRAGTDDDVKGKTLERIREYLQPHRERAAREGAGVGEAERSQHRSDFIGV